MDVVDFKWSNTTSAQRRTFVAAGLGWMLDAFDVMLYSIVVATLMREFGMDKRRVGARRRVLRGFARLVSTGFK